MPWASHMPRNISGKRSCSTGTGEHGYVKTCAQIACPSELVIAAPRLPRLETGRACKHHALVRTRQMVDVCAERAMQPSDCLHGIHRCFKEIQSIDFIFQRDFYARLDEPCTHPSTHLPIALRVSSNPPRCCGLAQQVRYPLDLTGSRCSFGLPSRLKMRSREFEPLGQNTLVSMRPHVGCTTLLKVCHKNVGIGGTVDLPTLFWVLGETFCEDTACAALFISPQAFRCHPCLR